MINEEKEIKESESEYIMLNIKNDNFRDSFANQLINGLGEKMITEIKNPYKPTKYNLFKIKINRFINSIFEVL